jgi:hypothetical protein
MNAPAKAFSGGGGRPVTGLEEVPVYKAKERTIRVQAYVPESFQQRMGKLARLWSLIDRMSDEAKPKDDRPKEPLKEWTEAEVIKRLLEAGIDTAFQEFGGEPKTEDSWSAIEKQIASAIKKQSQSK